MSERAPPPPPVAPPPLSRRRRLWLWLVLGVTIPVASFFTLAGLTLSITDWRPRSNPSGAMMPTLVAGDYFLIDRQAYAEGRRPRRGDIVTFILPKSAGSLADGPRVEYVKRIIALPGEEVAMGGGVPVIDGTPTVNRDDSLDSRHGGSLAAPWWFVPADHLIGRANYIYWSGFERLDRIGLALK